MNHRRNLSDSDSSGTYGVAVLNNPHYHIEPIQTNGYQQHYLPISYTELVEQFQHGISSQYHLPILPTATAALPFGHHQTSELPRNIRQHPIQTTSDIHHHQQQQQNQMASDIRIHQQQQQPHPPSHSTSCEPPPPPAICRFYLKGICRYGSACRFSHSTSNETTYDADGGGPTDSEGATCLINNNITPQDPKSWDCIRQHEKDMEISFAIQRSKDKTCGVCFEVIIDKCGREKRFGILPNCNHIFCLQCIRKWRLSKQFDYNIIRACPECRVTSDFVCPSTFWVDTKEEKDKLITDYKNVLGQKDCKYFKQGGGRCPFGNKCFYRHVLPNGAHVDLGVPQRKARHVNRMVELDVVQNLEQIFLWEFMEDRDHRWIDDIASFFSDSEQSDWSEYDVLDF